jgi:hypothetical protein
MNGGAVARRVERLDVSMSRADGSLCTLALVRKWGIIAEVTALAAAQEVRPAARAIPELVASGRDGQGWWMITPFYVGRQAGTGAPPAVVFDSLARLHARFRAGRANLMGVPVVNHAWWQRLCRGWAAPLIERCGDRHLGYRWAAVQIPLQYLPWTARHRPGDELAAAAGRAETALAALAELGQAGPAQLS